jgi:glyoxalase family protein
MGVGVVHHVAWRTPNDATQLQVRETLVRSSLGVTPVIDRNYFHSIYFNEPGGVIFEVATDPPGFMIDETKDALGSSLKLPEQYEPRRFDIERALPPIRIPEVQLA